MPKKRNNVGYKQFYKRPINLLIMTLLVAFALLVSMLLDMYNSNKKSITTSNYTLQIEHLKGSITYIDEALTMSARMASLTGDLVWEDRYNNFMVLLDAALTKAKSLAPEAYRSQFSELISVANDKRISMETQAFSAIKNSNTKEATDILFSSFYQKQKDIFKKIITHFNIPQQHDLRLSQLNHQITYLDEILTMSARMASLTGDKNWEDHYLNHVPILDTSIHEATQLLPQGQQFINQTAGANEKLIAMETLAFERVGKKRLLEAQGILLGSEYATQKQVYSSGMEGFSSLIESSIKEANQQNKNKINIKVGITLLMILITTIITYFVVRHVRLAEIELAKRNGELERKTEELESFAYSLSHDLRAPLKTIQGFSKRLWNKLEIENNDELSLFCEQINKNALRLDGLIEDTLKITQSENLEEDVSEINFEQCVLELKNQFAEINRENPIELFLNLNHKKPFFSQTTRIYQILGNLISNSIKYAKTEEYNPYVDISTKTNLNDIFEIRINGIGVAKDQQDKVFSMFFRAQSSVSFGSGLGLHLVKKNVEKLGGNISFNSSKTGTEFIIHIPQTT